MKVSLRTKVVAAVLLMAVMVAGVTGTMDTAPTPARWKSTTSG